MQRWQIGDVRITKVLELEATGGSRFILPQATREAVQPIDWMFPHFMDEEGRLKMSVHALVVETPDRRIGQSHGVGDPVVDPGGRRTERD